MKKLTLLIFIGIILFSCSSDENSTEQKTNLNDSEYVILFPLSTPINSLEINNELYIFYNDDEASGAGIFGASNKLSKVGDNGIIQWTRELDLNNFPDLSIVTSASNSLNFFYQFGDEFNLLQFDLDGNLLQSNLISNESFDLVQKNQNDFYLIKHNPSGIHSKKYSFSGNLLETTTLNITIEEPAFSKTIIKNNKSYLFSISDFNGSSPYFYDNYFCEIYEDNNLSNTINNETSNSNAYISNSIVLNNGNILLVTMFDDSLDFLNYEFKVFDSVTGNQIANRVFESSSNIMRLFLNADGNIGFVGGYARPNDNSKWSRLTILDSNLNMISQRILGSLDIGEIFFAVNESSSSYYITGRTDGRNGDFDLPNNSTGTDMFLYKLNK